MIVRARHIWMLTSLFALGCGSTAWRDVQGVPGQGDPEPTVPETPRQPDPVVEVPTVPNQPQTPTTPVPEVSPEADKDPLFGFLKGEAQFAALCARGNQDEVSTRLCTTPRPVIRSLVELQQVLGLAFQPGQNGNGQGGNPLFTLTGHSSSLVARSVSAINPRAIIFTRRVNGTPNPDFIAMGFTRGEQFVELAARDPAKNQFNFFLVAFEQACNANNSCSLGDLLTPAVESNWTGISVYQDTDLKNTVMDCMHCHQPAGPGTQTVLRMQELNDPWTHFFRNNRPSNVLINDFRAAHGNAAGFGGIPAGAINNSDPEELEDSLRDEGFRNQPNQFATRAIENEVNQNGTSATWQRVYDASANGAFIPVPYFGIRVTDPNKLATATQNITAVRNGTIPTSQMMDIREVFLDSAMPALTFRPRVGATGAAILVQMCQRCHNPSLDQTISRARFDVTKLATMPRAEKDLAIERVRLGNESRRKMPPHRFGEMSPEEVQLVVDELRK